MLKIWRRVKDYVRHDLREIIAPSSLPYPPGEEQRHKQRRLTWRVLVLATRDYLDTWKPRKDPEPEPGSAKDGKAEMPLAEELAGIARAGAGSAQPLLQHLFRTRAAAYRNAVRQFVEGYREGYAGLPDEEEPPTPGHAASSSSSSSSSGAEGMKDGGGGRAHAEEQGAGVAAAPEQAAPQPDGAESCAGRRPEEGSGRVDP